MFKILTFRSDGAFWPLAERAENAAAGRSRGLFARFAAAIAREFAARRATQTLASLDERLLRDIGLERGNIGYATRHGREALRLAHDRRAELARWA
jgi:uncharacterized protein YjiS (DUF1127 family)